MSKHKNTATLFLFREGQMHLHPSIYFDFHATNSLKQYLKLNRHVTKYADISIFNFTQLPNNYDGMNRIYFYLLLSVPTSVARTDRWTTKAKSKRLPKT